MVKTTCLKIQRQKEGQVWNVLNSFKAHICKCITGFWSCLGKHNLDLFIC